MTRGAEQARGGRGDSGGRCHQVRAFARQGWQRTRKGVRVRIEDYALIGDLQTSALVGRNGSVDWLCLPRFDSPSCFTALLGEEKHGRWLIAPAGEVRSVSRRYREGTLVLETDFETADGAARVIDFMPPRDGGAPQLVRIVQGLRGRVPMRMELIVRFGYGLSVPWVQRVPGGIVAQAGPDAVHLSTPVELRGENLTTVAELTVSEGASERFVLSWFPSYESPGRTEDAHAARMHGRRPGRIDRHEIDRAGEQVGERVARDLERHIRRREPGLLLEELRRDLAAIRLRAIEAVTRLRLQPRDELRHRLHRRRGIDRDGEGEREERRHRREVLLRIEGQLLEDVRRRGERR